MRLSQVRFFLAVIESGGIRAAARELAVSPAAITKSLRQLEESLHVRLFERTQHGAVPTAAGRAFVPRARAVRSELRKAEEECEEFAGGPARGVAFGGGPSTMFLIAPAALTQFRRDYPDARVRIVEGNSAVLLPMVRERTLDFAIGLRPVGKLESALRFRPLFRDTLVIVARKGHPLRNERSLARLAGAHWLANGPNWVAPALGRLFAAAGVRAPRPACECDSVNGIVGLLAGSDLLAAMPARLLASPLAQVVLQQIPVAQQMPSNTHGLFARADAPLTPVASAMTKAVIETTRQLAYRRDVGFNPMRCT